MTPKFFSSKHGLLHLSDSALEGKSEVDEPENSDQAQQAGQWLSTLDSSGYGRSSQNDRSEKGKLDTIGLAVADS